MSGPDITPTNYTHDESYSSMSEEEQYGIVSTIIDKVLDRLGISEEMVEKAKKTMMSKKFTRLCIGLQKV